MDHPPDPKTFIDEKTVLIVRDCHSTGAAGPESDEWMDGLSAAELLMQFGIDPNVVFYPDGKLHTPEGDEYSFLLSDSGESSSSSEKAIIVVVVTKVALPMPLARNAQR